MVAGDESALGGLRIAADWIGAEKSGQRRRQFGVRIGLAVGSEEEARIVGVADHAVAIWRGSVVQQGLPLASFRQTGSGGAARQLRAVGGISAGCRCVGQKAEEQQKVGQADQRGDQRWFNSRPVVARSADQSVIPGLTPSAALRRWCGLSETAPGIFAGRWRKRPAGRWG